MNVREMTAEEMYAASTYSVIRSPAHHWHDEEIIAAGLPATEARLLAEQKQKEFAIAHPTASSWGSDIFFIRLDQSEEIHAELLRRRVERCKQVAVEDAQRRSKV